MRKITLLLLSVFIFISCSKDESENDPIAGTYVINAVFVNGDQFNLDFCFDRTNFNFNSEGSGTYEVLNQTMASNDCEVISTGNVEYTNSGNGYLINSDVEFIPGLEFKADIGTATLQNDALTLTFRDGNDSYTVEYLRR